MPENTTFEYHSETRELRMLKDANGNEVGYIYPCQCGIKSVMTKHQITFDEQGKITVYPSIGCPKNCGHHVYLEHGVARDA